MRVLVCGGRDYRDDEAVFHALYRLHRSDRGPVTCVIHGLARGADEYAARWARDMGVTQAGFRAEWATLGPGAGPRRNARMLAEGKPDLVLAFPGGRGTTDMVRKARAAGVEVVEVGP